jgi:hypothetical protein
MVTTDHGAQTMALVLESSQADNHHSGVITGINKCTTKLSKKDSVSP